MENPNETLSDIEFFEKFKQDPRSPDKDIIQGAHRFISLVIKGDLNAPKNAIIIEIIREFLDENVKDYVFTRMGKKILLELALVILQDLAANGPQRAKALKLKVVQTVSGGKTIVHPNAESFARYKDNNTPENPPIEAAHFTLSDSSGASPTVKFKSGTGLAPPYTQPDPEGYFTPRKKSNKKSLLKEFEVCNLWRYGQTYRPCSI